MFEMILFLVGIYALVFGKMGLPWNLSLAGWKARVVALVLLVPLPLTILLGRVIGRGLTLKQGQTVFGVLEIVISALAVGGVLLIAHLLQKNSQQG